MKLCTRSYVSFLMTYVGNWEMKLDWPKRICEEYTHDVVAKKMLTFPCTCSRSAPCTFGAFQGHHTAMAPMGGYTGYSLFMH